MRDAPAEIGWANDSDIHNSEHRHRYEFVCRKCCRSVVAREENLFAALDYFASRGESELSLSTLAARVASSST